MPTTATKAMLTDDLFSRGAVTIAALKTEYGIGRTTAYELMGRGRLPYTTVGTRRLIPRAAVARLLAEGLKGLAQTDE